MTLALLVMALAAVAVTAALWRWPRRGLPDRKPIDEMFAPDAEAGPPAPADREVRPHG